LGARRLFANTVISVQFESNGANNYSGVEPDAANADSQFQNSSVWNHLTASGNGPISFTNLVDNNGIATSTALSISNIFGSLNATPSFPDTTFFNIGNGSFSITGLVPNEPFTLFLYAFDQAHSIDETFTVGTSSFNTANATSVCTSYGPPCRNSEDPVNVSDASVTGVTTASGAISGTWISNLSRQSAWSGFQLDIGPVATAVPEPAALTLVIVGLAAFILCPRWKVS
jgi:hypothetical protein